MRKNIVIYHDFTKKRLDKDSIPAPQKPKSALVKFFSQYVENLEKQVQVISKV